MTLDQLRKAVVSIKVDTTCSLLEWLGDDELQNIFEEAEKNGYSDEDVYNTIIEEYFNPRDYYADDFVEEDKWKIEML